MPNTRRRSRTPPKTSAPAVLWNDTLRHAAKAYDYTERGEWLGAYYNTLLAALACKHCVEARYVPPKTAVPGAPGATTKTDVAEQPPTAADAPTFAATSLVVPGKPRATLDVLYAAIPYYQRKVVRFQEAFACPNVREQREAEARKGQGKRDATGIDGDCDRVPAVDLAQVAATTFDDLVGNDLCKTTILDTLVYPVRMPHLYPHLARALLFYGPPGTGKTLLAKATAHELNRDPATLRVLFFAPTGDAFKGKYVGETEANIVRLFRCASQKAAALEAELQGPRVLSVLFVDEIDSIARNREDAGAAAATVANATNTLLQMMDGIQSFDNIVVMGATNFPWNLDAAVLRRFGHKVYVPLPDEGGVRALLEHEVVRQLQATLYARVKPTYFQAQRTVHECFERWAPLHGLDAEALAVLASEMTTTTKHAGYAPRDIKRLCDVAMTREAQKASTDAFFLVRRRLEAKSTTDTDASSTVISSRASTTDIHQQVGMPLADELLRFLDGTHVSRLSFERLKVIAGDALDTDVPPVYLGRPPFPTVLRQRQTDANGKRTTATYRHVRDHPSPYAHVYQSAATPTDYVLFRTTTVRVRHTTHTVPVYVWCTLGLATSTTPTIAMLIANATTLWFVLDDIMYTTRFPKGDAVVPEVWTTAHPEPWSTDDADTSWLTALASGLSLSGSKANVAHATKAATVGVDTRVGRLFLKGSPKWTDATAGCAVDELDDNDVAGGNGGNIGKCVHVAYSPQRFVDARREVRPSAKVENLRGLEKYQRGGQ